MLQIIILNLLFVLNTKLIKRCKPQTLFYSEIVNAIPKTH